MPVKTLARYVTRYRKQEAGGGVWTEKSNAPVLVPIRTNLRVRRYQNQGLAVRTFLPMGVCEEYVDLALRGNRDNRHRVELT